MRVRAAIICVLACLAFMVKGSTSVDGMLLVANKGAHSVGFIDPATGKQIAEVDEGGITGHELAGSPDGKTVYVPIYGNSGVGKPGTDGTKIVAIDAASHQVTGTLDFGKGVRPHCPVFGPKNGLLYVTTELEQAITIIDPHTFKIVGSVPTGQPESHMLTIAHNGHRGYTANVGPGTVSVLDLDAKKTLTVIPISKETQRISISPDDRWVFTADQTTPRLAVIDTSSNQVKQWVDLPAPGYGTAATPDGKWLLVAVPKTRTVAVVDLATMKVAHSVSVPAAPQEVLIRPDGQAAYVSCDASGKVAEIGLSDWKVNRLIDAGRGADGLSWLPEAH